MRLRYTACLRRSSTPCLARSFSLRAQLMMLHRCPASFGRPHRWKRWDFGALRLGWSGPDRILRSMTTTAWVVSSVIHSHPVSGLCRSNRTNQQPVYVTSEYCWKFHIDAYISHDYPVGLSFFTRFDPVRVEIVLIYFNHVGTSCWTVIVLRTTGCVFAPHIMYIDLYICCRLFSYLILFGFAV